MASLESKGEIVPIELPNPEKWVWPHPVFEGKSPGDEVDAQYELSRMLAEVPSSS